MYAYAKVIIERPGVRAVPVSALTHSGDKTFCWTYKDGHAERTEIRTGVSDDESIEITNFQRPTATKAEHPWVPANGSERSSSATFHLRRRPPRGGCHSVGRGEGCGSDHSAWSSLDEKTLG